MTQDAAGTVHNYACPCVDCVDIRRGRNSTTIKREVPDAAATSFVPSVGDRVRIVLEGEIAATWLDGHAVRLRPTVEGKTGTANVPTVGGLVVSVEKLPDPEPDYRPGDVVRLNGEHAATFPGQDIFLLHTDWEWRNAYGQNSTDGFMGCDVTLLVRGGESVAAGGGNG